jgi:hypothetical protein
MHVSVGSITANGTMSVTITSQKKLGFPVLAVNYLQDNGVGGTFTLEMWLAPPKLAPGPTPAAAFEFHCPGPRSCHAQAEARAGKTGTVGSVHFTVAPGHTRNIRLALDKTGRSLLAKRGSVAVALRLVVLGKSSALPALTELGTVRFHSR